MELLFHHQICDRDLGSALIHVPELMKWVASKGLHLRTIPDLADYRMAQAEAVLVAIERGAVPPADVAAAIVASDPLLANDPCSDNPTWLVGAEAHRKWREILTQAIDDGELQLIDAVSLLPVTRRSTASPSGTLKAAATLAPPADNPAPPGAPTWKDLARAIADELFDQNTASGCRDSLKNYASRTMDEMQKRGIHGPRGRIDNPATVLREALQGGKWWQKKPR